MDIPLISRRSSTQWRSDRTLRCLYNRRRINNLQEKHKCRFAPHDQVIHRDSELRCALGASAGSNHRATTAPGMLCWRRSYSPSPKPRSPMPPLPPEPAFETQAVSPYPEIRAYELLSPDTPARFKSPSKRFAQHPGSVASDFAPREDVIARPAFVEPRLAAASTSAFSVPVPRAGGFPETLRDAIPPIELLFPSPARSAMTMSLLGPTIFVATAALRIRLPARHGQPRARTHRTVFAHVPHTFNHDADRLFRLPRRR